LQTPNTPEALRRAELLRDKYKMDRALMQEVDQLYGPLEWRLPEAHAIYWATLGLKNSKEKDLITIRRVIYQCMLQSIIRGRILFFDAEGLPVTAPNLDRVALANDTYLRLSEEDKEQPHAIKIAHRNFLREMIYHFYTHGREGEAEKWFKLFRASYPEQIRGNPTMEEFALERFVTNIEDLSGDRIMVVLSGLIHQHYLSLAVDDDQRAGGFLRMAEQVYKYNDHRIRLRRKPLTIPPLDELKQTWLKEMLKPENGLLPPELIVRLRTRLNLPAEEVRAAEVTP